MPALGILAVIFVMAANGMSFMAVAGSNNVYVERRWNDCGGNPDEARRRQCQFDILSFAWQTTECYDNETAESFKRHRGSWSYFADPFGQLPVDEEVVLQGNRTFFVTTEYHFVHCTYMWRQLHRAYSVLGFIDEHLNNWNHTLHCQEMLLNSTSLEMEDVSTVGRIIYPTCIALA